MYELTRQQAQHIVDRMMKDIPYNINIMDRTGIIIGSGNKARIGTLHYGAAQAIKLREVVEIREDGQYVKKGINLPIELGDAILGVVGISGEVENTRPFGNLLKTAVALLIEQNMALEKKNLRNHLKQEFFNGLIQPETAYTSELAEQAATYGLELSKPSQVVLAEFPGEFAEDTIKAVPSFRASNQSLCFILQEADKPGLTDALLQTVLERHPGTSLAVSKWNETVAEGYAQSKAAMRVLRGVYFKESTIHYSACELVADLAKQLRADPRTERLAHLLEKNEELTRTLQTYLSCNLNANETAAQLMIHRNTLHYRLNKIHSLTGKDPRQILQLVELVFMLIHRV